MSSNNNDYDQLKELGNSKYEVSPGESDIRNWVVKNQNGNILGEVQDLVFDTKARKVQFLVLDMNKNELNLKERKVLLPIQYADVNEAYKNVVFDDLMPNQLASLPTYEKGVFTRNSYDLTMSTFIRDENSNRVVDPNPAAAEPKASYQQTNQHKQSASYHETLRENPKPDSRQQENEDHQRVFKTNEDKPAIIDGDHQTSHHKNENDELSYTVIAVFEHLNQGQAATEYLLNHGFKKEEITISNNNNQIQEEQDNRQESGISHFFRSLFTDQDEASRYSDAASRGCVISVDVTSRQQANEAAEILDQHGSLNLTKEQAARVENRIEKGNSRIFEQRRQR